MELRDLGKGHETWREISKGFDFFSTLSVLYQPPSGVLWHAVFIFQRFRGKGGTKSFDGEAEMVIRVWSFFVRSFLPSLFAPCASHEEGGWKTRRLGPRFFVSLSRK